MAEYIEREAVIKKFKERCTKCDARFEDPLCLQCSGRSDLETVCDLPAADVTPVVHGHWIEEDGCQICSECGEEHEWDEYRAAYCDVCGAKMDGGVNECD